MPLRLNKVKFYVMRKTVENIKRELEAVTKERDKLKTEKQRLKKMLDDYRSEIETLRQEIHELKYGPGPGMNNIEGWTLTKSGEYFRLFKKVRGKVKGIHLGKVFDREKAIEKIKNKEDELGINPSSGKPDKKRPHRQ